MLHYETFLASGKQPVYSHQLWKDPSSTSLELGWKSKVGGAGWMPHFCQHTPIMQGMDNPFHSKKGITHSTHLSCNSIWNNPFHFKKIKWFSRIWLIAHLFGNSRALSFSLKLLGTGMLENVSELAAWSILTAGPKKKPRPSLWKPVFRFSSSVLQFSVSSNQCS